MSETPNWRERAKQWKALASAASDEPSDDAKTIGISASFTANALIPQLGVALHDAGQSTPSILIGEYNQLHQTCLDPAGQFGEPVDQILLLWRIEDLFAKGVAEVVQTGSAAIEDVVADVSELCALAANVSDTCPVLFTIPPAIDRMGEDPIDQETHGRLRSLHRQVSELVYTQLSGNENVELFDLDLLVAEFGRLPTRDTRRNLLYRQPYTDDFYATMGTEVARSLVNRTRSFPKCIAVDADNTLWGGIIGEDGIEGIVLSDDFPGSAHQVLQQQLLRLKEQGVLLAVVSKNEEDAVAEAFEKHAGMVLKASDIAAWRVNWIPKSENIKSLAEELNFGTDAFVFIDDSHFEVNEVRAALPEVDVLQVPEEPAEIPALIPDSGLFRGLKATADDADRTERIQQERQRKVATESLSREDFLKSLELTVTVTPMKSEQLERTTQLINKTNQFNLTTIRRAADEVSKLASAGDSHVFTCEVSDRFGDYGLVGVVIAAVDGDAWVLDSFLLSCRVLGRGVEMAILSAVKQHAVGAGASRVTGRYEATAKNAQVSDLYPRAGFDLISENAWEWATSNDAEPPVHINLVSPALS